MTYQSRDEEFSGKLSNPDIERWSLWASRQEPVKPRTREFIWIAGLILLALAHILGILEKSDPSQKLIEERSLVSCERAISNAERYAEVIAVAANGGQFEIGGDLVACKRRAR